jgi:hypothetical protein
LADVTATQNSTPAEAPTTKRKRNQKTPGVLKGREVTRAKKLRESRFLALYKLHFDKKVTTKLGLAERVLTNLGFTFDLEKLTITSWPADTKKWIPLPESVLGSARTNHNKISLQSFPTSTVPTETLKEGRKQQPQPSAVLFTPPARGATPSKFTT